MSAIPHPDSAALEAKLPPGPSWWQRNENWFLGTVSVLAFLALWEASAAYKWVNPLFTSSPTRIVLTGAEMFADGSI